MQWNVGGQCLEPFRKPTAFSGRGFFRRGAGWVVPVGPILEIEVVVRATSQCRVDPLIAQARMRLIVGAPIKGPLNVCREVRGVLSDHFLNRVLNETVDVAEGAVGLVPIPENNSAFLHVLPPRES